MKQRPTVPSLSKAFSFLVLTSLLVASSLTQATVTVHAQVDYTPTPASTPVPVDPSQPEPADQPHTSEPAPNETSGSQTEEPALPTDRIIVKYKSSTEAFSEPGQLSQMERASSVAGQQLNYVREMSGDSHVLQLSERLPLEQVQSISEQLMLLPEVEYAEPDAIMRPSLIPNDPYYASQWHYFGAWGIDAPAAWDITTGSSSIVMAVLDTGITNHADLIGRTVPGYDFISHAWTANDGNGRDNNPSDPGDWVAAGVCGFASPAESSSWHGTHVAGTMGAASNNGTGVAGVNWNSKILPVRVLGRCGGYTSDVADAMRWAAGLTVSGVPKNPNPARVLNLSLGGYSPCGSTYQSAINSITNAGSVVVVSAGNSAANAENYSPAGCNGVITVAATASNGYRASYSNYGSSVEISAPGGDMYYDSGVLSTLNAGTAGPGADTYTAYQGTSMAAPHVSGVVSLMFSINPKLTPAQVLQILQGTAKPFPGFGGCNTSICGAGIVNAGAAVGAVPPVVPGIPALLSPANGSLLDAGQPVLDWKDSDPVADHYQLQVATNSKFTALVVDISDILDSTFMPGAEFTPRQRYYWRVRAYNSIGQASNWSATRAFIAQLAKPILVAPGNTEAILTDRPDFQWDAVNGASQYNIQVSASSKFGGLLINVTTNSTTYTPTKDFPQNKTLYWRVRAKSGSVIGGWSEAGMFKTGNPATVPSLAAPKNNALVKGYTPLLNWNNSKAPGGTTFKYYEVQLDEDAGFASPDTYTTTPGKASASDFTPSSDLASNMKYYWRVRAVNTVNGVDHYSGWSLVRSFRTDLGPLTGLAVTLNGLKPTFDWDNASGSEPIKNYTIQVSTNVNFKGLLLNVTTQNSYYEMLKKLPAGKIIYWRVRVNGASGPSEWTKSQFTTP